MRAAWLVGIALAAVSLPCCAQFFPKSSLGSDGFKAKWYATQLSALGEPSLFALSKDRKAESYRFLWLRTFHHPVAVRLERQESDGSWVLVTKIASGAGGYSPGKPITNTSRNLSPQEVQNFLAKIQNSGFWSAPNPVDDQTGTDGSQWIIEGVKAGDYHVVDRWMPKNGPARDLGLFLAFELAKLNVPKNEIY